MADIESLRRELIKRAEAGGNCGLGGMFIEASDLKTASDEQIIEKAKREGIL